MATRPKKKKGKAKQKGRQTKRRKRSEATGRRAGKQPLALGEPTVKATLRLPQSEYLEMEKRAGDNVSGYLRNLVREDLKRAS